MVTESQFLSPKWILASVVGEATNYRFKPGSTFEQVCQLYEFDYELKNLLLANISKTEIAVRTQLAYIMSMAYDGFWIEDATLFANQNQHQKTIQSINDEYNRSDELFVKTFKTNTATLFHPVGLPSR